MKFFKNLFFSLILCLGGGWLSGYITKEGMDWYHHLNHPYGTPPKFIFPIVWSILYILMAISLTIILTFPSKDKKKALFIFLFQLILNFIWSWLFFKMEAPLLALIDLIFLWIAIFFTIIIFKQYSRLSAYLLLPYFGWVTYAFYLNLFIWIRN